MKIRHPFYTITAALFILSSQAYAVEVTSKELDQRYGVPSMPAYIKHFEVNKKGKFWLHPYLQIGTKNSKALLDPQKAPYNWVIDEAGNVRVNIESPNPYGRTYENGYIRPEDNSKRKAGTVERDGHVSILGGGKGRIGGEFLYNSKSQTWVINNKSGRYSNHNSDRTPEQLLNAVALIKEVVNPGQASWGETIYLLKYAPERLHPALLASPDIQYKKPDAKDVNQKNPYVVLKQDKQ